MNPILDVQNLTVSFKDKKSKEIIQVVNDVSFQVQQGEIFGLLGPNGAGKSSIIRMICGLLKPESGNVFINGVNHQNRVKSLQYISAVLEGNRNLYWRMTVQENISYFAGNRGMQFKEIRDQVDEWLHLFGLEEKKSELVGNLSRGMQQKVAIIVALCLNTKVILLDEPTLGLDVKTTNDLKKILVKIREEFEKTVIISTHDMKLVEEICERVVIIDRGKKIVEDTVEKLMKLFQIKSYVLSVKGGQIPIKKMDSIVKQFPEFSYDGTIGSYTVDISDSTSFYTFIELLKKEALYIESIQPARLDFERIFTILCERDQADVVHV
ncbi:ABC transporter ATP-binding protein [Desmospora activa]|uniref:ABC-2 type transport system ATP-binding protein n=1 Tax=Desmospora activa DSM 45169 TaxID=1121389 RepID=A0A2T4ZAC5_9BACL|nr:ABC transporter ATP-binding protein [Desmospora activa]PTM58841.1 ABC-2 type transport system ATP-binding protein [Desmospora activa DSM 45169]